MATAARLEVKSNPNMGTKARSSFGKPADKPAVDEVVLCLARTSIKPALRQELKNLGVQNIYNADDHDSCVAQLRQFPRALFILDWEHGAKQASALLHAAQGEQKSNTRPIFMLATSVSLEVVAASTEYNVSRMHTGELSRGAIQAHLEALMQDEKSDAGLREAIAQAAQARARGELSAARALLESLNEQNPQDLRLACELADILIETNRWDEAHAVLDRITAQDKVNLRAMHLKARCFMKLGRYEAAAAVLQEARVINPHHVERLVDLGNCLMQCNRVRDAIRSFEQALELDASNLEAARGRAQCQLLTGEINEALGLLRDTSGPRELASIFNTAAILSIRNGRFDAGNSLYKTAIGMVGTITTEGRVMARLVYNLGIAFHKQKRLDEALECFEQAFGLDQYFEKSRYNAMIIAGRLGRRSKLGVAAQGAQVAEEFSDIDDEKLAS